MFKSKSVKIIPTGRFEAVVSQQYEVTKLCGNTMNEIATREYYKEKEEEERSSLTHTPFGPPVPISEG